MWRPRGWTREELLFANDPNLALVVGRGSITSVDVSGDLQLIQELLDAWKRTGPQRPVAQAKVQPIAEKRRRAGLPPGIRMVLDVGHAMVLLADRVSEDKTTLTLASDGLHLRCFTRFDDSRRSLLGRRCEEESRGGICLGSRGKLGGTLAKGKMLWGGKLRSVIPTTQSARSLPQLPERVHG
jgi:hypothetical protein